MFTSLLPLLQLDCTAYHFHLSLFLTAALPRPLLLHPLLQNDDSHVGENQPQDEVPDVPHTSITALFGGGAFGFAEQPSPAEQQAAPQVSPVGIEATTTGTKRKLSLVPLEALAEDFRVPSVGPKRRSGGAHPSVAPVDGYGVMIPLTHRPRSPTKIGSFPKAMELDIGLPTNASLPPSQGTIPNEWMAALDQQLADYSSGKWGVPCPSDKHAMKLNMAALTYTAAAEVERLDAEKEAAVAAAREVDKQ